MIILPFCLNVCSLLKILCNLLAVDGVNDPDVLAINAGEVNLSYRDFFTNQIFFLFVLYPRVKHYILPLKLLLPWPCLTSPGMDQWVRNMHIVLLILNGGFQFLGHYCYYCLSPPWSYYYYLCYCVCVQVLCVWVW